MRYLVESGVEVTLKDYQGKTALDYAVANDSHEIVRYLQEEVLRSVD